MRKLIVSAVFLLCACSTLDAQWTPQLADRDDFLVLTAHVSIRASVRTTARLTNRTHHDVLLPPPKRDCSDPVAGSIWLATVILKPAVAPQGGCFNDYGRMGDMPIEQRIRGWYRLLPGQSLVFTTEFPLDQSHAARTTKLAYSARYTPPSLSPQDLALLAGAQIQVPHTALATPWRSINLKLQR